MYKNLSEKLVINQYLTYLVCNPWDLQNPQPVPVKTYTHGHRCGFLWVWVQVVQKKPRVTCDIP